MNERVVIVTGGGRGIGRAICRRFAREGAMIVAAARSEDELRTTKEQVEADGGKCTIQPVDVTAIEQLQSLIECTEEELGQIDVLVNNAGASACAAVRDLSSTAFETMVRVNVAAVFYACKFVLPIMEQNGGGVIVNISSMAAADPFAGLGTYGATKAWVNAFTRSLADEGKEAGIRAYAVGPGAVETRMLRTAFPDLPGEQCLDPADIAETVYALTQPAMAYASGQTFYVRK
jgi:NAD(P)-dependent dehydrogenase (short-subunit alcohol dehydrogenase family)